MIKQIDDYEAKTIGVIQIVKTAKGEFEKQICNWASLRRNGEAI